VIIVLKWTNFMHFFVVGISFSIHHNGSLISRLKWTQLQVNANVSCFSPLLVLIEDYLCNIWVQIQKQSHLKENGGPPLAKLAEQENIRMNFISRHVIFPTCENGVSASEASWLRFEKKIASGPFSDLWVVSFHLLDMFVDKYMLNY